MARIGVAAKAIVLIVSVVTHGVATRPASGPDMSRTVDCKMNDAITTAAVTGVCSSLKANGGDQDVGEVAQFLVTTASSLGCLKGTWETLLQKLCLGRFSPGCDMDAEENKNIGTDVCGDIGEGSNTKESVAKMIADMIAQVNPKSTCVEKDWLLRLGDLCK
mmetsp:Transcript_23208/g.64882  ORF Transcript_23208/g.64882 Transcript_23208/m.64882 type:complete len:162 (+) Transcript_23208:80-565(+)